MRSRRGDIRTSRKSMAAVSRTRDIAPPRILRAKRKAASSQGVSPPAVPTKKRSVSRSKSRVVQAIKRKPKSKATTREKAPKLIAESREQPLPKVDADDQSVALGVESKRRRTDTAEYIKKRFLYDVEDEPRRLKNRRPRAPRLPTASVTAPRRPRLQMKQGWHKRTPSEEGLLPLRSRRGRRVKPKQDYSPMSHENEGSPNYSVEQASPRRLTKKRRGKRGRRQQVVPEPEVHQRRSTWELPDLFNADDNDQMDELSQAESSINDSHKQRFPDTTDLPNYSDVLLDSIPSRTTILGGTFDDHDRRKRALREHLRRCDQRKIRHRHPASPNLVQKGSNAFHHGSLLSPGHSSDAEPHHPDVIDFCTEPTADQFRRRQEFDEFDHTEDEYIQSSGSRAPSEEPNQTPHEELEEEELLAPELSLLAGQSDNGNLISGSLSNCGGSRRKSPVRPMQVLRTKSHSTVTSGPQAPILVSNSDENPFIFHSTVATAGGYNRQHPGGDDYMPTVFQSTVMEKNSEQTIGEAHFGLKAASVLRLPSSSNTGASAIAIRSIPEHTLQLPVSTECSSSSPGLPSLLPSILNQSNSRTGSQTVTRAFPAASSTTRPTTAIPAKSLLSHSTSAASRRRPTILKRGAGPNATPVITNVFAGPRHTDVDDTVVSIPVTRAIGTFSSANVHKPTAVVQVATTTSATQSPSTPAKLLQLVSTPSIPSPQLATNLTASDKLFGRRPSGSTVLSTTSLTVSGTGSTFMDVTEAPTSTVHPYRYALLRGSADGKRYLVLGNQGLFEKNSTGSVSSTVTSNVSDEALTAEQTEAIDALQSQTELPLGVHASRLITESHDQQDSCSIDVDESMKADRTPALRGHLAPSFKFSTTIPASTAPSVAAI